MSFFEQQSNPVGQSAEAKPARSESPVVLTLKGSKASDSWLVLRGETIHEVVELVKQADLQEMQLAIQHVQPALSAGNAQAGGGSNFRGGNAPQQGAPDPIQPPEGYVYKEGTTKQGRAYRAFMPIDRNSGLNPIWL